MILGHVLRCRIHTHTNGHSALYIRFCFTTEHPFLKDGIVTVHDIHQAVTNFPLIHEVRKSKERSQYLLNEKIS